MCGICGKKVNKKHKHPHKQAATLDHIIPLSKGGKHEKKNVQLAHYSCNSRKNNRVGIDQLRLFYGGQMEKTRKELMDECTSLADFEALGEKLGYKPGWAAHVWQARQDKEALQAQTGAL
jgi:hypothetical protein